MLSEMVNKITPEMAKEIRRLLAEIRKANKEAFDALTTHAPGQLFKAGAYNRFVAANDKVGPLVARIREIQGTSRKKRLDA